MDYQLVERSFRPTVAGYSPAASGVCPEPGCGRRLKVDVNFGELAKFPSLLCLEGIIICNDCADFRHALRETQDIVYFLTKEYRNFAMPISAKSRVRAAINDEIEKLDARFRPNIQTAVIGVLRVLARRSGKPVSDEIGWSTRFMIEQWEGYKNYGGEDFVKIRQENPCGLILAAIRTRYGIVLRHHGYKPKPPAEQLGEPEF